MEGACFVFTLRVGSLLIWPLATANFMMRRIVSSVLVGAARCKLAVGIEPRLDMARPDVIEPQGTK